MDREHGADREPRRSCAGSTSPRSRRRLRRGLRQGGAVTSAPPSAAAWSAAAATRSSATCTARRARWTGRRARGRRAVLATRTRRARRARRPRACAPSATTAPGRSCWRTSSRGRADERIDFVAIVTPNHVHYPVAKAFVEAGFHVVCDKPLTCTPASRPTSSCAAVERAGVVFGVTYNYTGYPMVRQARDMVRARRARHDPQGHRGVPPGLARDAARDAGQQAGRLAHRPGAQSGAAGAMGDIGSHAENLLATVTGAPSRQPVRRPARLRAGAAPGRRRQHAAALQGGARGVLLASQIAAGRENDCGCASSAPGQRSTGARKSRTRCSRPPLGEPHQILTRGNAVPRPPPREGARRMPAGHPEGYLEAFANVYLGVFEAIRARKEGRELGPLEGDFPRVEDGARGVRFIEAVVEAGGGTRSGTRCRGEPVDVVRRSIARRAGEHSQSPRRASGPAPRRLAGRPTHEAVVVSHRYSGSDVTRSGRPDWRRPGVDSGLPSEVRHAARERGPPLQARFNGSDSGRISRGSRLPRCVDGAPVNGRLGPRSIRKRCLAAWRERQALSVPTRRSSRPIRHPAQSERQPSASHGRAS